MTKDKRKSTSVFPMLNKGTDEELLIRCQRCGCRRCKTTFKYAQIISKLPVKEREWMSSFYNIAFDQSATLELLNANYDKK